MTLKKVKKITIEVWDYLAAHPKIQYKNDLPHYVFNKISTLYYLCPYCEYFRKKHIRGQAFSNSDCNNCPLNLAHNNCMDSGSYYQIWDHHEYYSNSERSKAARTIADSARQMEEFYRGRQVWPWLL